MKLLVIYNQIWISDPNVSDPIPLNMRRKDYGNSFEDLGQISESKKEVMYLKLHMGPPYPRDIILESKIR